MSDQDFFFDEDETPAKSAAKKSAPAAKSSSSRPVSAAAAPVATQSVSMAIAMLIGVIALLVGVIGGIFVGKGLASGTGSLPSATATGSGSTSAPSLSNEQIQNAETNGLPAGHPDISKMGGNATSSTATTTGK